jgi:hypothetical protein
VALTITNRRPEIIVVEPVVIPELELCNVERQIFRADLVESPDHAALSEALGAFDSPSGKGQQRYCDLELIDGSVTASVKVR